MLELPQGQIDALYHLRCVFCHGAVDDAQITKVHDGPEGWLRVNIIPFYFWVDPEGIPRHIGERNESYPRSLHAP